MSAAEIILAIVLLLIAVAAGLVLAACIAVMADRQYLGIDDDIHPL